AAELPDAGDATVVAFARDGVLRAAWTLVDPIDPNAREVVAALLRRRLDVAIVTGDRRAAASAVAAQLHVLQDHVHAECSPVRKAEIVTEHERAGSPVLFVGDGFNDAAALAAASVGAAMGAGESGGGTDLARAAGRLILLRGELPDVLVALDVAKATVRTIAQNLLLAVAYNVVAIPWAMGLLARFGVVSPEPSTAGLAMAASSLAVVLNAFRLSLASARFGSRR
ncbi:MAG TPA: HAD-IC family P-type ATPase, partial [Planctomycetota bacterium]|nr:HAD-IC family P-type ATPase [Planctomycetota bacterium]